MKRVLLRAAYAVTSRLGPARRAPNRFRRAILPALDGVARRRFDRPLVRDKTDAREHIASVPRSLSAVERALSAAGYRRNALATLKYIRTNGGRTYERGSWVRHDGDGQHHVYVFETERSVHLWGHEETSYLADPEGHEGHSDDPNYARGDPAGRLHAVLASLRGEV